MSPFSKVLRQFRIDRGLKQKVAAELLGYEQSYLCALESGAKGPPKMEFLVKLSLVYKLNEREKRLIHYERDRSNRNYLLSEGIDIDEYIIWYRLHRQSRKLLPIQIQLINSALSIGEGTGDQN